MFLRFTSPESVPERTRKIESWPENGSERVLKTKQDNGASGDEALSEPSSPMKGARSKGEGKRASTVFKMPAPPLFSRAEHTTTGTSSPATTPVLRPSCRSSSERLPSSRYFSINASSLSAIFSTVTSLNSARSSAIAAGTSVSFSVPSGP